MPFPAAAWTSPCLGQGWGWHTSALPASLALSLPGLNPDSILESWATLGQSPHLSVLGLLCKVGFPGSPAGAEVAGRALARACPRACSAAATSCFGWHSWGRASDGMMLDKSLSKVITPAATSTDVPSAWIHVTPTGQVSG